MDSKQIWSIEYCKRQDQFHIGRLDKIITENLRDLLNGKRLEWIIVGVAPLPQDAAELTEIIRKKIGPRKKVV